LIKITMSPHPASPPPTPPQGPLRRWGNLTSTPISSKTPPPPPPKTSSNPPGPPMPHQISEARARLRSTGRTLDEIDSQREIYNAGRVHKNSYSFSQNSDSNAPFTPPMSPTSYSNNYSNNNSRYQTTTREDRNNSYNREERTNGYGRNDSFSRADRDHDHGRFDRERSYGRENRFGNYCEERDNSYGRKDRLTTYGSNDRENNYTNSSHVGRSQSFHASNLQRRDDSDDYNTWKPRSKSPQPEAPPRLTKSRPESAQFSTLQHPKKSDKLFRLFGIRTKHEDSDGTIARRSKNKKSGDKLSSFFRNNDDRSKDRNKENDYHEDKNMYHNQGSTQFSAKMVGKYSDEGPVPPPRTKRRPRPQTTYFFGQDSDDNVKPSRQRPHSIYANVSYDSSHKNSYRDENNYRSNGQSTSDLRNTSFRNDRDNEYGRGYNSYGRNKSSHSSRFTDEMNHKNDYYSLKNDGKYSKKYDRDYSNERCDSGYGDPHDSYNNRHNSSRNGNYSGRSVDSRKYEEKTYRKSNEERKRNQRKNSR